MGGGVLSQVSYGGVQLRGPNPYPISGKAGLWKQIPYFREISQFRAPEAVQILKTYPILGKFDKITPYFREIW